MTALEDTGQELEVLEHAPRAALAAVQVAPQVEAKELVRRLTVIEDAMRTAMKQDVDYGVIPGTGTKPTLLKPGAEKLGALFQLDVQLDNQKIWHDDGHLTVICRATVFHQPTGSRLGSGEGICTTREAKYAYRNADRVCPECGEAAIIKGKEEFGGGWLCWRKPERGKNGCGTKFRDGDQAIESQVAGKVPNENIADAYNTVDKMASKRARIDAVLAVTGASALFTQDIEDFAPASDTPAPAANGSPQTTPPAQPVSNGLASEAQIKNVRRLIAKIDTAGDLTTDAMLDAIKAEFTVEHLTDLSKGQAAGLIDRLMSKAGEKRS